MKKTDFLKFIDSKHACSESQDWIKSLPVKNIGPKTWAKYLAEAQPDWAVWLAANIGGNITTEYERAISPARAEYERIEGSARAEYDRVWSTALAEFDRVVDTAWAEYERIRAPARAKYERAVADASRKLLTFEAVSKEVDNFLKTF